MNALHIFLGQFWPFFVTAIILFPLLQWGGRVSLNGNAAMFTGPRSFKELSAFSKEEHEHVVEVRIQKCSQTDIWPYETVAEIRVVDHKGAL